MLNRLIAIGFSSFCAFAQEGKNDATQAFPITIELRIEDRTETLQGKIVAPAGYSMDTLTITSGWFWDSSEKSKYRPWDEASRELRDGRITVRFNRMAEALFAFDEKNRMGAVQVFKDWRPGVEIVLDVKPLVEVRSELICKGRTPSWAKAEIYVSDDGGRPPIAAYYFENGTGREVRLLLPHGKYEVLFMGTGARHCKVPLAVDGKDKVLDLKRVDLAPSSIENGLIPQVWKVTEARGVDKSLKLSDYRGKWVFLEFWGYW